MKIVRKPIDVIAVFKRGNLPMPVKCRVELNGKEQTIKIDTVSNVRKQQEVGKGEIVYTCQGVIDGKEKIFEVKFLLDTIEWVLYKM